MPNLTTVIVSGLSTVVALPLIAFASLTGGGSPCSPSTTASAAATGTESRRPHSTGLAIAQSSGEAVPSIPGSPSPTRWSPEQITNAATIVRVGATAKVPPRGWVIAVAVALQESGLHNIEHGDVAGPDSRGLFQQRAAWGPLSERMDAAAAALLFYTGGHAGQPGLLDIPDWQTLPLTRAANAVQRSAHPDAYAVHEDEATQLVTLTAGSETSLLAAVSACGEVPTDPGAAAGIAVAYARNQLGLPYEWGGNGPSAGDAGYDCSGLTTAAYAAAGITLPRTAQTQYDAGPLLSPETTPATGDLVFFGTDSSHVTHVGIVTTPGYMIDAPHRGALIRSEPIWTKGLLGYSRPATRAAPNESHAPHHPLS
jgi:cell wall-associated NlpC family hydrolase